jgi:hypothetical protein
MDTVLGLIKVCNLAPLSGYDKTSKPSEPPDASTRSNDKEILAYYYVTMLLCLLWLLLNGG